MVRILNANDEALEPLQDHYSKYEFNEEVNVDAMSKAAENYSSESNDALDALNKIDVPDDTECKAFHRACVNLMEDSPKLATRFGKLINYIKEHNPATEADLKMAGEMFDEITGPNAALSTAVSKAQKELVKKHDLKLN